MREFLPFYVTKDAVLWINFVPLGFLALLIWWLV